ncbi:MAG: FAD-dependent oxidoreductase, partial [Roseiflexaceae bacterium]|nr:FAD-dependent oxidoreductase [Roseiflexaceae bacterium]
AMSGLYLQPDSWYDEHKITPWLNTLVTTIDRETQQVRLATGEHLSYDRLILANGSSSFVPPIPGFGMPGTFVLREAQEAMEIRAFVQAHGCRNAIIGGGGLLGLEAGYALHKLGMHVSVLERGEWLLRRQLDQRGSSFLRQYLEALGIDIVVQAEAGIANGAQRVEQVVLKDGRTLDCDLLLIAVGIQPNVELARSAGIDVNRGIIVDETMRTSAPGIFATGDVCEFQQQIPGLWPVAVEQARIAAINAMGGQASYREIIPVTALKVVGVDLTSIGRFEARSEDETVIALEDTNEHRYRKLVIANGKIIGAILLGYPQDAAAVTAVIKQGIDITDCLDDLNAGRWDVLQDRMN